jgi:hypothetical protein
MDACDRRPSMMADLYAAWERIVAVYSEAKFTKLSDKFVALDGLVELFCQLTGDVNIAGLWLARLWDGLLWATSTDSTDKPQRHPEYIAPSWSWASLDGPVWFVGHDTSELHTYVYPNQLKDFLIQTASESKGKLINGFIKVQGYAPSLAIHIDDAESAFTRLHDEYNIRCVFDVDEEVSRKEIVFPLLLRLSPEHDLPLEEYLYGQGIILAHAEGSIDEFVRVGYFYIREWREEHLHKFGLLRRGRKDIIVDPKVEQQTFTII